MAQPQVGAIQIPFVGGVDQSTRPELLDAQTSWVTGENIRQAKRGGWGKRYGFTAQTLSRLSGSRSAGYKLFSRGQQSCVIDGHYLDVYSYTATANVTRDRVPECSVRRVPIQYPGLTPTSVDVAYVNGYLVVASVSATGSGTMLVQAVVLDATSYAVLRTDAVATPSLTAANCDVRVAGVGTTAIIVYPSGATTLSGRTLDLSTAAGINTGWTVAASLVTDVGQLFGWDMIGISDRCILSYGNTAGGANQLSLATFSAALASIASTTVACATIPPTTALCREGSDTMWLGWTDGTAAKAIGYDPTSLGAASVTVATVITSAGSANNGMGICSTGTGSALMVFNNTATGLPMYSRGWTTSVGAVTPAGSTVTWYWAELNTRPVYVGGRAFTVVCPVDSATTNPDRQRYVVDVTDASDTLRAVGSIATGSSLRQACLAPHVASISLTRFAVANIVQRAGTVTANVGAGLELAILDFGCTSRWQTVDLATYTALSGGVASYFDGTSVAELGFLVRPNKPTTATGGTGITAATGWLYLAVYEHVDAAGYVHTSGTSDPSASTGAVANKTVTVTVSNLFLTSRYDASNTATKTRIALYRTSDGGSTYYRHSDQVNVTSAATQTFTDATADATLVTKATLYRQPGTVGTALDRRAPPAFLAITFYAGMLVGVADDGFTLWHSGQQVVGEGAWFNPVFQLPIAEDGTITAIATQDGTLFVFKRGAIYAVQGDAPADNGSAGGLGAPRRLAVDVGCIDPRSVVVTSLGIFFQSSRGLELLTRSQSVEWIGEPVQDTTAAYPICTAATLDAAQNLVVFELATTETANQVSGTGRSVVFDLTLKLWVSTDRRANSAGTADAPAQSGAVIYTGSAYRYAWLGTDGRAYVEDQTTYLDPGSTWVTMRGKTAKIRATGLQGNAKLHSVAVLAESATNHQTRINVAYDDSSSWTDSETWTASEVAALTREQLEVGCSREQVMSVQIQIEDLVPSNTTATPLTTGAGATWVGLALNVGPNNQRQGTTLLPSAHRK